MKNIKLIIAMIFITAAGAYSQSNYTNQSKVISAGGGWSGNALYQQFSVVGENIVNTYLSNNKYNGTLGFIFNDESIVVAPPKRAVLIYPPNNSLQSSEPDNPLTISFYWVGQEDVTFNLQLSKFNNFVTKIIDTVVTNNYCEVNVYGEGDFYWKVLAYKGELKTDWSETWKFSILITGIEENIAARIYPNPVLDFVHLIVDNELVDGNLTITDMYGRSRFALQNINKTNALNLSKLEAGIYFISIVNRDKRINKKFIKQ